MPGEKPTTDVKQYLIEKIETVFRAYTPEEIYYKILFELFNPELDLDAPENREIKRLETSVIYQTLFDYQKKGVVSLIKKIEKFGGAILADAVGLGKTFSALAVMKYYQNQGYSVVLLCPKKLEHNWTQYLKDRESRFADDGFDYLVRFHTDLDGRTQPRLEWGYEGGKLSWMQTRSKLLLVIDESHNLRNDKSTRYINLLEQLVKNVGNVRMRDFKVLQLSATPINNSFDDIKSQFNLIGGGNDAAFSGDEIGVPSLANIFMNINRRFNKWSESKNRTIKEFVETTPPNFFKLTDNLVVARTRHLIEHTLGENLGFPKKGKPKNIYRTLERIGDFRSTDAIYNHLISVKLAAYMPSRYLKLNDDGEKLNWDDDRYRETFLVRMMMSLFFKRLESSWYSLKSTLQSVLAVHQNTLDLVNLYLESNDQSITIDNDTEAIDDDGEFVVGKRQVALSAMENIDGFRADLESDVQIISEFLSQIESFEEAFNEQTEEDPKLEKLLSIIDKKQSQSNKKLIVFTAYADTAEYLYSNIRKQNPSLRIAKITGSEHQTYDNRPARHINDILQRFAPYSKLYKELDWRSLYESADLNRDEFFDQERNVWNVDLDMWKTLIKQSQNINHKRFADCIDNQIDVLIATDCLSEGQNLQDADVVVNYDIHWNPVRIIQRLGRIDRIGSPNAEINSYNFWPTENLDKYLKLEDRIVNRISAMTVTGAEVTSLNQDLERILKDNPIVSESERKLLQQMQNDNITDIEQSDTQTLSLSDFSLEMFRQDLREYFNQNRDNFRNMPNGAFSGFSLVSGESDDIPESLVAVVAYPHRARKSDRYSKIFLMLQPVDTTKTAEFVELNYAQILNFLHEYRHKPADLPEWILRPQKDRILNLSAMLKTWLEAESPRQAQSNVMQMLLGGNVSGKSKTMQEEFDMKKYDLLAWEYVSRKE